jgi:hypothetical protein
MLTTRIEQIECKVLPAELERRQQRSEVELLELTTQDQLRFSMSFGLFALFRLAHDLLHRLGELGLRRDDLAYHPVAIFDRQYAEPTHLHRQC